MTEKIEEPISQARGWVNARIVIVAARSYSRMIRGARLPIPLRDQDLYLDSVLGLVLAQ